jgi:IS30 family transposase
MLVKLQGKSTQRVIDALIAKVQELPVQLMKSLTWDRGLEMADHKRFTVDTGVTVYFANPKSPWQRGSNENNNGLLRQYFPHGTNFRPITHARLDEVAVGLNGRSRQTLDWRTPSEKLSRCSVPLRSPPSLGVGARAGARGSHSASSICVSCARTVHWCRRY